MQLHALDRRASLAMVAMAGGLAVAAGCSDGTARNQAHPPRTASAPGRTVENARAFAKLYGHVRYFHPSDEAASIQWDRLAVHGSGAVAAARDPAELESLLESLFAPLAPTLLIYRDGEVPEPYVPPAPGKEIVAWQHLGVALGAPGPYRSIRVNRDPEQAGTLFASVPRVDEVVDEPLGSGVLEFAIALIEERRAGSRRAH